MPSWTSAIPGVCKDGLTVKFRDMIMTENRQIWKIFGWVGIVVAVVIIGMGSRATEESSPNARTKNQIGPLDAVILGVVEGITEYLPVSSTGHLILTSHSMGLSEYSEAGEGGAKIFHKAPALDAYEIVIQLGAILAVLGLYRRRVRQMLRGLFGKDREGLHLALCLFIAFLPAAVVGLLFRSQIKAHLFKPVPVALALAAGGVLMLGAEYIYRRKADAANRVSNVAQITYRGALLVGLFQCLALWPGTSRSMVTIVGGLAAGLGMVAAAEFSFLLALPTLGAATLYEGLGEWRQLTAGTGLTALVIGTMVSLVVAFLAVEWLVKWLTNHGLTPFGIYRILLAGIVLAYFFLNP